MVLIAVAGLAFSVSGCAQNDARPAALTGEEPQQHRMHDDGLESQVSDL
jgi:hypothetical protein